jgi:glutathione synthase/RimK-type ligase-like ATP-grasp enzyme
MLGGEILSAAKRTSTSDFRSNFSLGGKAEIVSVPDEVKDVLRTVNTHLGCDFVGVDFIRHDGRWILNEIEDMVGTRMLYSLTDIDAAKEYVEYIIKKVNTKV